MITIEKLKRDLNSVREQSPVIHNITNYVVMNNTANALLAIGASPVMAHSVDEIKDMVGIASALVLNIGTLDKNWVESMLLAGSIAQEKGIPIVLDPVGAGATKYRTEVSTLLIEKCRPTIIRGNASEIMALVNDSTTQTKGVDSRDSSDAALESAKLLAKQSGAVVVISGETDYITDGTNTKTVFNGNTMMARVTGMGCTATAIVAAFAAINKETMQAATHAMAVMGVSGERAAANARGNGSLQTLFLDELYNLSDKELEKTLRIV